MNAISYLLLPVDVEIDCAEAAIFHTRDGRRVVAVPACEVAWHIGRGAEYLAGSFDELPEEIRAEAGLPWIGYQGLEDTVNGRPFA